MHGSISIARLQLLRKSLDSNDSQSLQQPLTSCLFFIVYTPGVCKRPPMSTRIFLIHSYCPPVRSAADLVSSGWLACPSPMSRGYLGKVCDRGVFLPLSTTKLARLGCNYFSRLHLQRTKGEEPPCIFSCSCNIFIVQVCSQKLAG